MYTTYKQVAYDLQIAFKLSFFFGGVWGEGGELVTAD